MASNNYIKPFHIFTGVLFFKATGIVKTIFNLRNMKTDQPQNTLFGNNIVFKRKKL